MACQPARCISRSDANPLPVAGDRDQTALVGAEHVHLALAQGIDSGAMRVSITVFKPGRDHTEGRVDGVQQLRGARGAAAVVPHLQHVGMFQQSFRKQLLFDLFSMSPVSRKAVEPNCTRITSESSFFGLSAAR